MGPKHIAEAPSKAPTLIYYLTGSDYLKVFRHHL